MPVVCGIKFRGTGKVYYFSPGEVRDLQTGDQVIVETARGVEMGQVAMPALEVDQSEIVADLKPILRRATPADLLDAQNFRHQEPDAVIKCRELVAKLNLPMKITGAEYNYDGTRLTFFFTAEQRVDFRELVRELAHIFRTRIDLRQIGVRDEAKIMGGIGKCGRPLCCATWLSEFCPVSIRMAKQQDLPLSPMEISGLCGRLLCCLDYENDYYQEVKGRFPKVGKTIETPIGPGKVIRVSALKETTSVLMEDGTIIELTADQLAGNATIQPESGPSTLNEKQRQALNVALPASRAKASDSAQGEGRAERPPDEVERKPASDSRAGQRHRGRDDEVAKTTTAPTSPQSKPEGSEQDARPGSQPGRSSHRRRRFRRTPRPSSSQGQNPPATNREDEQGKQSPGNQAR